MLAGRAHCRTEAHTCAGRKRTKKYEFLKNTIKCIVIGHSRVHKYKFGACPLMWLQVEVNKTMDVTADNMIIARSSVRQI